jgi:hypothetical protein
MDVLQKYKDKANLAASVLEFEITYEAGVTEDLDTYKASFGPLNINCYAGSEEDAIKYARIEAEARFMETSELANVVLTSFQKSRKQNQ